MLMDSNLSEPLSMLILEDNVYDAELMRQEILRAGLRIQRFEIVDDELGFKEALVRQPDIILADYSLPQFDAVRALDILIAMELDIPFILVSGSIGEDMAVQAMKMGAADYLLKDRLARLSQAILNAIEERRLREEKRASDAEMRRQFERLAALRAIDVALASTLDLSAVLTILLDQVDALLGVDAASILLLDPNTGTLRQAASRGVRIEGFEQMTTPVGLGMAGLAASERRIVGFSHPSECLEPSPRTALLLLDGFVEYRAVPLIARDELKGVLEICHREELPLGPDWWDFLAALSRQAALALHHAAMLEQLQRTNAQLVEAYDETLDGWSRAVDLRDKETEGHSRRVTEMTLDLAKQMGLAGEELVHIRRGALLHDIGKLGIPDKILLKPGKLTDEEWVIMRRHPQYAYEMLRPIEFLGPALDIPYCHHEKWDGTGYPRGLRGAEIPLSARIFALADIYDALTSDRPYRAAWSEARTRAYILSLAGTHLDPEVVRAFEACRPVKREMPACA